MIFQWKDYSSKYADLVDSWLDSEAIRYTGCEDGWEEYFNYWKNHSDTQMGINFWGKIVLLDTVPIAVISLALSDCKVIVSEFIVSPAYRRQGWGTKILQELISCGQVIIGSPITSALAVIYPDNISSQKAFEKADFKFESAHPDGDAWYYTYQAESFQESSEQL
jgi:RimJ/RimL family protein N-acetyltransferase